MGEPKTTKKAKAGKFPNTSGCTPLPQNPSKTFEQASQSSLVIASNDSSADDYLPMGQPIGPPIVSSIDTASNNILILESIPKNNEAASQSGSISGAISALSEPLTEFALFPKLPLELRFKVFNLALTPQSVYISRNRLEYERQYKVLKKRASDIRPRFGPVFVNYSIDYVHFFHTSLKDKTTWAGVMARKLQRGFNLIQWMKPAQRVAIRLRQRGGDRGLCAPKTIYNSVWEEFNKLCPEMKELVFIIADRKFPRDDLVELKDFSGKIRVREVALHSSFEAAQVLGFNVSAKLVVMGSPKDWVVSKGKVVEIVNMSD